MKLNEKIAQNPTPWLRVLIGANLFICVLDRLVFGFAKLEEGLFFFSDTCTLLARTLLCLYLCVCFPKKKQNLLLPISYGFYSIQMILQIIQNLNYVWGFRTYSWHHTFFDVFLPEMPTILINLMFLGCFAPLVVIAATGLKHTKTAQNLIGVEMVLDILVYIIYAPYYWNDITGPHGWLSILGILAVFAELAGEFISWRYGVNYTAAQAAQRKLYALKHKLDRGAISQQEYDAQKAELLRKL